MSTYKRHCHRTRNWDEVYMSVKSFYDYFGHLRCDYGSDKYWLYEQRRNRHKLSSDQIRKLDDIGFDWETKENRHNKQWDEMFNLLKEYKLKHGNCRVPQRQCYRGKNLGIWVSNQMRYYRIGKIRQDRKERLERVGFEWCRDERPRWVGAQRLGKLEDQWQKKFQALRDYKKEHGDTIVPPSYLATWGNGNEFDLGTWVVSQRRDYKNGVLRSDRLEQLASIDFVFEIDKSDATASWQQKRWDEMFEKLVRFKQSHGNCNVSRTHVDRELASWVQWQRHSWKAGKLLKPRFQRLEALGFVWKLRMGNGGGDGRITADYSDAANDSSSDDDDDYYNCADDDNSNVSNFDNGGPAKPKYDPGTKIEKAFIDPETGQERVYSGKINRVRIEDDGNAVIYCVIYSDGDEEDMDEEEIVEYLASSDASQQPTYKVGTKIPIYKVGAKIQKAFPDPNNKNRKRRMFSGEVTEIGSYNGAVRYKVVYEDGDWENMDENEIRKYIVVKKEQKTKVKKEHGGENDSRKHQVVKQEQKIKVKTEQKTKVKKELTTKVKKEQHIKVKTEQKTNVKQEQTTKVKQEPETKVKEEE